jgi:hypothetical protein
VPTRNAIEREGEMHIIRCDVKGCEKEVKMCLGDTKKEGWGYRGADLCPEHLKKYDQIVDGIDKARDNAVNFFLEGQNGH